MLVVELELACWAVAAICLLWEKRQRDICRTTLMFLYWLRGQGIPPGMFAAVKRFQMKKSSKKKKSALTVLSVTVVWGWETKRVPQPHPVTSLGAAASRAGAATKPKQKWQLCAGCVHRSPRTPPTSSLSRGPSSGWLTRSTNVCPWWWVEIKVGSVRA